MRRMLQAAAATAFLLAAPHTVTAVPIAISGSGALGSFEGVMDYDAGTARLTIELTNTSPAPNGGFITALAFNNPNNAIGAVFLSANPNFDVLGKLTFNNTISVSPFGDADIGAAIATIGGDWLGGGNPSDGIGVGVTETFVFSFSGSGLSLLSTADFMNTLSTGSGGQPGAAFLIRFRGFEDGGSDKVPGVPDDPNVPVPEPVSLTLVGSGLAVLAVKRRFRSR